MLLMLTLVIQSLLLVVDGVDVPEHDPGDGHGVMEKKCHEEFVLAVTE